MRLSSSCREVISSERLWLLCNEETVNILETSEIYSWNVETYPPECEPEIEVGMNLECESKLEGFPPEQ